MTSPQMVEDVELPEDITQWRNGKELRSLITTPSWEIVLNTLQRYADSAEHDLYMLDPGDTRVGCAHAAWSAAKQIRKKFEMDVLMAVENSYHTPESIKQLAMLGANDQTN